MGVYGFSVLNSIREERILWSAEIVCGGLPSSSCWS